METWATPAHGLETLVFEAISEPRFLEGYFRYFPDQKTMELAYSIDQLIALDTAAGYFDLHNCYDVARVHCEGTTCYVSFTKLTGDWVKPTDHTYLTLVFEQTTFLQLSEGLHLPTGLEFIGFQEPEEVEMTWFRPQPGSGPVHLVLGLDDEAFIRIGATASYCLGEPVA